MQLQQLWLEAHFTKNSECNLIFFSTFVPLQRRGPNQKCTGGTTMRNSRERSSQFLSRQNHFHLLGMFRHQLAGTYKCKQNVLLNYSRLVIERKKKLKCNIVPCILLQGHTPLLEPQVRLWQLHYRLPETSFLPFNRQINK